MSGLYRAQKTFAGFVEALPGIKPTSMLDIGSGRAVKSLLIADHYKIGRVHLMDGTGGSCKDTGNNGGYTEKVPEAWSDVRDGYNNFVARLPHVECHWHIADPNLVIPPVDLIVSFRSWGHHFNINAYTDLARRCLTDNGLVVTDIRRRTEGEERMIAAGFVTVMQIPNESEKARRLVFKLSEAYLAKRARVESAPPTA